MKNVVFAVLTIVTLLTISCTKDPISENSNQILVRFHNTLGSKIEASRMEFDPNNMTSIGEIPAGSKTDYIPFDYFEVGYYPGGDYEFPVGNLVGQKDGVDFLGWSGNWCGTGVAYKQLEPGLYTIKIVEGGTKPFVSYLISFVP